MPPSPLVTAIIIFYNAERFLPDAIHSVFHQSYQAWELLLVDDGSTDGSPHLARRLAGAHPERVRYLEHAGHANRGMSATRNLGLRAARGRYVAFLDADDVWEPGKLEAQVAILEREPEAAMVYGRTQYWYGWTGHAEDQARDALTPLPVAPDTLVRPPVLLTQFLNDEEVFPCTCSIMVRREVFDAIGGFEEAFRDTYEDMVFHAKVFLHAPVYVAGACWDRYRLHPDNSWKAAIKNGHYRPDAPNPARRAYLTWLEGYLRREGIEEGEVWKALNRALWPYRHPALYRHTIERPRRLVNRAKGAVKKAARKVLSPSTRSHLRARLMKQGDVPRVGGVRFGGLRRLTPVSRLFGFDRGQPVDRYYIERFLAGESHHIRGRVLEVADNAYTQQFGQARVAHSDVLDIDADNPDATLIADLAAAEHLPSDAFDCIILTQTLHLIYEAQTAVRTLHRMLKPGGVLLATFPGISQISHYDWGGGGEWHWGFTTLSAQRLFAEVFSDEHVYVAHHGNVLAAIAFLHGLAADELRPHELEFSDPDYQVLITVKATKPEDAS